MIATACARLSDGCRASVAMVTTVRQRSSSALVSPLSSRPATMATGPSARSRTSSAAASRGRRVRRLAARSRPVSTKSAVLCAMPSMRHGSNTSGSTSRMRSIPKFLAMRTALAMLTMSWGLTRTRMGDARPPSSLAEEGDVMPLGLERGGKAGLFDGLHVRFLRLDLLGVDQLHQRVVEGDHACLAVGLHHRGNLERLALADEVRDRGNREQDLARGHAPAADLLAQRL